MQHEGIEEKVFSVAGLPDLERVAKELLARYGRHKVWLFHGEMGVGKTTLIKALCRILGVQDLVSSPTFSIINEYLAGAKQCVCHFDFYRIRYEEEAHDIGAEEYFYSGNYCFIEWPERIPSLIPPTYVSINMQGGDTQHRTIAISIHDGEEENRI